MPKQAIYYLQQLKKLGMRLLLPLGLLLLAAASLPHRWHEVAPGIDYRDLDQKRLSPWSHIHVFRIDLTKNRLDIALAKQYHASVLSAEEFLNHSRALLSINGGFFDANQRSLGLRLAQDKEHSPLKNISWWAVFYVKNHTPTVSTLNQYAHSQDVKFAIQSGPRLIVNGKITHLKPGLAERSALGITRDGHVIMLATENNPLTTHDLALILQSPQLDCIDALNLDGGSSTQISAHMQHFTLNVQGYAKVADAVLVRPITP